MTYNCCNFLCKLAAAELAVDKLAVDELAVDERLSLYVRLCSYAFTMFTYVGITFTHDRAAHTLAVDKLTYDELAFDELLISYITVCSIIHKLNSITFASISNTDSQSTNTLPTNSQSTS